MALIKCGECGKEVSDKAAACLGCGAPIARPAAPLPLETKSHVRVTRTGARWEGIGFVLIIVGMITAMASIMAGSGASVGIGGLAVLVGFVVFIIGRFK